MTEPRPATPDGKDLYARVVSLFPRQRPQRGRLYNLPSDPDGTSAEVRDANAHEARVTLMRGHEDKAGFWRHDQAELIVNHRTQALTVKTFVHYPHATHQPRFISDADDRAHRLDAWLTPLQGKQFDAGSKNPFGSWLSTMVYAWKHRRE